MSNPLSSDSSTDCLSLQARIRSSRSSMYRAATSMAVRVTEELVDLDRRVRSRLQAKGRFLVRQETGRCGVHKMFVEYWPVGETANSHLPMTRDDVSRRLAEDWVPFLPGSMCLALMRR